MIWMYSRVRPYLESLSVAPSAAWSAVEPPVMKCTSNRPFEMWSRVANVLAAYVGTETFGRCASTRLMRSVCPAM